MFLAFLVVASVRDIQSVCQTTARAYAPLVGSVNSAIKNVLTANSGKIANTAADAMETLYAISGMVAARARLVGGEKNATDRVLRKPMEWDAALTAAVAGTQLFVVIMSLEFVSAELVMLEQG